MRFAEIDQEVKLRRFVAACRGHGLSVTHQRMAIYGALAESREHPGAERLYDQVRKPCPNISLATVYKTLDTLESIGLIRRVTTEHEAARFDANLDRHHHLVCSVCRCVIDYYDEELAALQLPETALDGAFAIEDFHVQVTGRCATCGTAG